MSNAQPAQATRIWRRRFHFSKTESAFAATGERCSGPALHQSELGIDEWAYVISMAAPSNGATKIKCAVRLGTKLLKRPGEPLNSGRHSGSIASSNARLVRNNCEQRLDRSRETLGGPLPPDPSESTPLYCCPNNAYFSTAELEIVMNGEPKPGEGGKILEIHRTADSNKQTHEHVDSLTAQLFSACLVAVYDSIEHAEKALHILHHASFPKDQISVVMARLRKEPELLSEITIGEASVRDAALSAGLGGVLGYLGGIVAALVTGAGTFFLIGPIAGLFGGATLAGCLGAIAGLGVRHEHIRRYEQDVSSGKVLVVAHGDRLGVDEAARVLKDSGVGEVHLHGR